MAPCSCSIIYLRSSMELGVLGFKAPVRGAMAFGLRPGTATGKLCWSCKESLSCGCVADAMAQGQSTLFERSHDRAAEGQRSRSGQTLWRGLVSTHCLLNPVIFEALPRGSASPVKNAQGEYIPPSRPPCNWTYQILCSCVSRHARPLPKGERYDPSQDFCS